MTQPLPAARRACNRGRHAGAVLRAALPPSHRTLPPLHGPPSRPPSERPPGLPPPRRRCGTCCRRTPSCGWCSCPPRYTSTCSRVNELNEGDLKGQPLAAALRPPLLSPLLCTRAAAAAAVPAEPLPLSRSGSAATCAAPVHAPHPPPRERQPPALTTRPRPPPPRPACQATLGAARWCACRASLIRWRTFTWRTSCS